MKGTLPDFKYEIPLWAKNSRVLGIDEAGRGAFAGPLAVAGVSFNKELADFLLKLGINDSKLLSAKKREELYKEIKKHALFSHVEFLGLDLINSVGIGRATTFGMSEIYKKASKIHKNLHLLIDAFKIPDSVSQTAIVHGDRISVSIAAASILAKVERDKFMTELSLKFPKYGFELHKGYGTKLHREVLKEIGPCEHHRTQFVIKHI